MLLERDDRVTHLLDVDGAIECDALAGESLCGNARDWIGEVAGRDGRVVRDLLGDEEGGFLWLGRGGEVCYEELAEECVERFLDALGFRAAAVLLAVEGKEEPFQYQKSAYVRTLT